MGGLIPSERHRFGGRASQWQARRVPNAANPGHQAVAARSNTAFPVTGTFFEGEFRSPEFSPWRLRLRGTP
ncbi:MAG: hypothetical protein U1F77_07065 [Kiritimatiellia bacterium]